MASQQGAVMRFAAPPLPKVRISPKGFNLTGKKEESPLWNLKLSDMLPTKLDEEAPIE